MAYQRYIGRGYTAGNVTPVSNVAVSLGQPQKRWKEVYVDANSLHLGNVSFSIGKTNQIELMRTNKLGQPVANVALANAVAIPLKVMDGGTGATSLTDGGVLLGSGTGAITALGVLGDGEVIVGDGSTDPVAESGATLRTSVGVGTGDTPQFYGANVSGNVSINRSLAVGYTDGRVPQANLDVRGNVYIGGVGSSITTSVDTPITFGAVLGVASGGIGASSLTDGHVLLGSGTGAVTALDVTAKGSILVGDGSGDPVALAVGDDDQVLSAASGEASGLEWVAAGTPADGSITSAKLANPISITYAANVTGNASINRSLAVGYTDGRVPQANLDVKGNVYITGITTHASYSHFPDDVKVLWGDNITGTVSDLEMYHGGTHSFIKNKTGDLRIKSDSLLLKNQADDETYLDANNGGSIDLYYDNTKKLETTGTGVNISGLGANIAGNTSIARSLVVGYTDHRVPQANLDVRGNAIISSNTTVSSLDVTNYFKVGDGAVAQPSIANLGDGNTGIWYPGADTIATSVGGREAVRITGSARGGLVDSNVTISSNVVNHKGLATANYTEYANNITNAGSSFTVSTGTNMARYTLNSSHCEITLPAGQPIQPGTAKTIILYLKQDATGGRTVDFNAPGGEALEWNNSASEPEVVSGASKVSIYTFMKFHGDTNWYCSQSFIEN